MMVFLEVDARLRKFLNAVLFSGVYDRDCMMVLLEVDAQSRKFLNILVFRCLCYDGFS